MRARLFFVFLVCLLLLQSTIAVATPPPTDDTFGGELPVPALAAPDLRVIDPQAPDASFKWYTVAGAGFIPYTNSLTWTYGGSGCLEPSASGFWRANINLPDGSIMRQVSFGFYNSATSTTSTAYIYRYNYSGAIEAVVSLNSTAGSGGNTGYKYTSANIAAPGETVYNYTNAYMFSWSGSGNQQLCYIQVGYTPPSIFGVALPTVVR